MKRMKGFDKLRAVVLAGLVVFQSCGILEPREAQAPETTQETQWVVPNTPKDVFLNLKSGFASTKDSNYDRSLDPTFTFVPLAQDVNLCPPGAFDNWTKDVELQVLRRIKGDFPASRAIQFGTGADMLFTKQNIEGRNAYFEGEYVITLNAGSGPQTYAGIARFTVYQGTLGWVLTKWEDIDIKGTDPTAGFLRGSMRATGG